MARLEESFRSKMVMVSVGTLVGFERNIEIVVIGGNFSRKLGFFQSIIDNFIGVANPATFRFVDLVRI